MLLFRKNFVRVMGYPTIKKIRSLAGLLLVTIMPGCATMKNISEPEPFTAIEQFLMTQAIEFSLNSEDNPPLSLLYEESIKLDATRLTDEHWFLIGEVSRWLGEQGFRLQSDGKEATYRIQILVQGLGIEQSRSFFGVPAIQSTIIPFALPEIAFFKAQYRSGYTRFRLDIFETLTGKYVGSTPWFQASTYFNEYTILFFIGFNTTNLIGPFE